MEEFKKKTSTEVGKFLTENGVPVLTCDKFEGEVMYHLVLRNDAAHKILLL